MQELYNPKAYPQSVRDAMEQMPALATEIANRWMLGWPESVKTLLARGVYLTLLTEQEAKERQAYLEPGNSHLARHEIAELYGLNPAPPAMENLPTM